MYRATIVDKHNIPRAWAEGSSVNELLEQAVLVTSEYTLKRPDAAPLYLGKLQELNILANVD